MGARHPFMIPDGNVHPARLNPSSDVGPSPVMIREFPMTMLWHIQIEPAPGQADHIGERLALEAADLGIPGPWSIRSSRGFLVEGDLSEADLRRMAAKVLSDDVVEVATARPARDSGRAEDGAR